MKRSALARAMMIGAIAHAVVRPSAGSDPELARFEADYGKSSIVAFAGNGGLTVGLDSIGRIAVCRWPSPSFYDQVWCDGAETQGVVFGIEQDGEVIWAPDARWTIVTEYSQPGASTLIAQGALITQGTLDGPNVRFREYVTVHPNSDTIVVRFEIIGAPSPAALHVWANFSPTTRKLQGLPLADARRDAVMDFAAFVDPQTQRSCHFRPFHPNAEEWKHAERLSTGPATIGEHRSFRDGVWIVCGPWQNADVTVGAPVPSVLPTTAAGPAGNGSGFVAGDTYSHFRIPMAPSGTIQTATWAASFAGDYNTAAAALDSVLGETPVTIERLRVRSDAESASGLDRAFSGVGAKERALLARAFLTLANARDRRTGSVVRGPSAVPPLARDWPRNGAWIALALDAAGRSDWAQQLLSFYLDQVRAEGLRGIPSGALPSSMYADGTPAGSEAQLDVEGAGLVIWAAHQHVSQSAAGEESQFLIAVWPRIRQVADFLVAWADPRSGRPWHAYDPAASHDARSQRHAVAAFMGLDAAIRLSRMLSETPPIPWIRQYARLEARLLGTWRNGEPTIGIGDLFPFVLADVPNFGAIARFQENRRVRLEALTILEGVDAARTLCELAFLYQGDETLMETLRPNVLPVLRAALATPNENNPPDALAAAYSLLAAHLIYRTE